MKKIQFLLILALILSVVFLYRNEIFKENNFCPIGLPVFSNIANRINKNISQVLEFPFKAGEEIIFDFFLYNLKSGKSDMRFLGKTNLDNQEVLLIESSTKALNYKGKERIFTQTDTFYPVRVERSLKIGWDKENIIEEYNLEENSVTIKKNKNGRQLKDLKLSSDGKLQHVISLLYFLRTKKDLSVGEVMTVNLPKAKLRLKVERIEDIKVPYGKEKVFFITDAKGNLRIWMSVAGKLPLQFQYKSGMKNYSMKMREVRNK